MKINTGKVKIVCPGAHQKYNQRKSYFKKADGQQWTVGTFNVDVFSTWMEIHWRDGDQIVVADVTSAMLETLVEIPNPNLKADANPLAFDTKVENGCVAGPSYRITVPVLAR